MLPLTLILGCLLAAATPCQGLLLPEAVGFWKFDSRQKGWDNSRQQNSATLKNTVFAEGPYGDGNGSVEFSGATNSYATIPNNGALNVYKSFTWMAWLRKLSASYGPLFSYINPDNNGRQSLIHDCCSTTANRLHVGVNQRGNNERKISTYTTEDSIPIDQWVHLTVTYDGSTLRTFLNWTERSEARGSGSYEFEMSGTLSIGSEHYAIPSDARSMHARMACVQLYNVALTGEQIRLAEERCRTIDTRDYLPTSTYPHPVKSLYMSKDAPSGNSAGEWSGRIVWTSTNQVYVDGMYGMYLDGTNSYGQVGALQPFHSPIQSFTWCGYYHATGERGPLVEWFRTAGTTSGTSGSHIWIYPSENEFYAVLFDTSGNHFGFSSAGIVRNAWNFLAVTYDFMTGIAKLYIDNEPKATYSWGSRNLNFDGIMWIGRRQTDNYRLQGTVNCYQFFDVALSVESLERVKQRCLYHHGVTTIEAKMAGWWPLNRRTKLSAAIGDAFWIPKANRQYVSFGPGPRGRKGGAVYFSTTMWIAQSVDKPLIQPGKSFTILAYFDLSTISLNQNTIPVMLPDSGFKVYISPSGTVAVQFLFANGKVTVNCKFCVTVGGEKKWIHLTVVYDAFHGSVSFYLEGEKVYVNYRRLARRPGWTAIKRSVGGYPDDGRLGMSCLQVFREALTTAEITKAMSLCSYKPGNRGKKVTLPLPLGMWPLNIRTRAKDITGRSPEIAFDTPITFEDQDGPFPNYKALKMTGDDLGLLPTIPPLTYMFDHTVCFWAKPDNTVSSATIFNYKILEGDTAYEYQQGNIIAIVGTRVHYRFRYLRGYGRGDVAYQRTATGTFPLNEWSFITVTYNFTNGLGCVYVNGDLIYTKEHGSYLQRTNTGLLVIGGVPHSKEVSKYTGGLACLQVYDVALTQEQVRLAMQNCRGRDSERPKGTFVQPTTVPSGFIQTAVSRTISSRILGDCMSECYKDENCESVNFGGGQCDLCDNTYEESVGTFEHSSEKEYYEVTSESENFD